MTDPTARDLIKRLTDELEFWSDLACTPSELPLEQDDMLKLITEARAYLAQPEPEGPTDEELIAVARAAVDSYPRVSELPYFMSESSDEYEPMLLALRAVASTETQVPNPIPLSVRQPTEADCSERGCCWWHGNLSAGEHWFTASGQGEWTDFWLPHWALPLPHS